MHGKKYVQTSPDQEGQRNNVPCILDRVGLRNSAVKMMLLRLYSTQASTKLSKKVSDGGGILSSFYNNIYQAQTKYSQHLLMARVGDFYEFYFDQAQHVSQILNIKLARTNGKSKIESIPFCGFPSFKMWDHVRVLLQSGHSIAKYEQYERFQADGRRSIFRRVDRIFTPGNSFSK